ncbi:methyltransferase [Sphingosinicella terrae]|uniref:methyltransferase n=1 Tax=Sphingosinicella terrae TaxID=2172047 RepID=UPI000E0DBBA9|nr:methyltransferase [Sphingosinicella terrae]
MPLSDEAAALVELLGLLSEAGYRFVTVTPATHERVLAKRREGEAAGLRDIFGWNLPFRPERLPAAMLDALRRAGGTEPVGDRLKSRLRVSSLEGHLFVHSAYPTDAADSVFFGPDTYRFVRFIAAELAGAAPVRRLVEIGAGSGAAALVAAGLLPGATVTLTDLNPRALETASANAAHAGVAAELVEGSGLDGVEGDVDLILANPPYMMDEGDRTYRQGGGLHGAGLSLDWALAGARRLEPGGRMLLYTGVAIVDGHDALRAALLDALPATGCRLRYAEIDPDIFGEELEGPLYRDVERIAAVGAVIERD